MPANLYCTVEEIKSEQGINDAEDDSKVELVIEAISRAIDRETWRRFFSTTETRYFTATSYKYLYIDDITSVDALATDDAADRTYSTTWASTDYDLYPFNALAYGVPYTSIEVAPNGNYAFPRNLAKGVKITGDFGYIPSDGAIPSEIKAATVLGSVRMLTRFDTPLGVSAAATLGQLNVVIRELRLDPDFMGLISPFRRTI